MLPLKFFVTGTDTEIGKTYTSVGLLKAFNQLGYSTLGIKPIASGCVWQNNQLVNEDALALQAASTVKLDYAHINPFTFEPPIAPHIAAARLNQALQVDDVFARTQYALHHSADVHLVEGVGGWFVPLNHEETMANFVEHAHLRVILVVGLKLGCLNHALLTYHAIQNANLTVAGWVANCPVANTSEIDEMVLTLKKWLKVPCLGVVKHREKPEEVLDIQALRYLAS